MTKSFLRLLTVGLTATLVSCGIKAAKIKKVTFMHEAVEHDSGIKVVIQPDLPETGA